MCVCGERCVRACERGPRACGEELCVCVCVCVEKGCVCVRVRECSNVAQPQKEFASQLIRRIFLNGRGRRSG